MQWPWTGFMYSMNKTRLDFNWIRNITQCFFICLEMKECITEPFGNIVYVVSCKCFTSQAKKQQLIKLYCKMLTALTSVFYSFFFPRLLLSSVCLLLVVSACRNTFHYSTCWSGALMTVLDVKWFPLHFFSLTSVKCHDGSVGCFLGLIA